MTTIATITSLTGQAWAQTASGQRRLLKEGDRLSADEMLVTAPGAQVDVDFGQGNLLTFAGEQEIDLDNAANIASDAAEQQATIEALVPLAESADNPIPPANQHQGSSHLSEGHNFVSLVEIHEIIEADGITHLTLARIKELLRPLNMSLPEWQLDEDYRYEHRGTLERETGPASRTPGISIKLKGAGPDDIYNEAEIIDGTVPAHITLDDKVRAGDILVVTDGKGNQLLNRPVTEAELSSGVIVQVPVTSGDNKVTVNATITTPNGSTATSNDEKPVDNITPLVEITLEGTGDDGIYNESEIKDGKVSATVTLDPNTVKVGDTLKVTTPNGEILLERPVTQDDIDNGVPVQVPVVPGQETVIVEATITDPAGNSSSSSDEKPVDNITPTLKVELEDAGPDGVYNESEIKNGKVPATVTLDPGTVKVGDTLKVTTPNGDVLLERPVTQDDIDNGVPVQVPVTPGQTTVTVEATITDPAGNISTSTDEKLVDNITPTLKIELEGYGDDGVYNESEIVNGKVPATVTLDKDTVKVGDTLVVKTPSGGILLERPVTQDDIDNGVPVQVPVVSGQETVIVEATITDLAGNSSSSNDEKPVDNITPTVEIKLQGTGDDDIYNESEIVNGKVPATVTLDPNTVKVGDTLKVTTPNGEVLLERPITQDDINNGVPIEVPVVPGQETVTVEATITDPAGNISTSTDEKPVDNIMPTLKIELEGYGDDGVYNESEIVNGKVPATVTLDKDTVKVGDTLVVKTPSGGILLERPVTQDDIDNGVPVQVPVVSGQETVIVEATITDPAGNSSSDSDTKSVDNITPTVEIKLQGTGDDDIYNESEIVNDKVPATVTLDKDTVKEGDTLVVKTPSGDILLERPVTQDDITNGVPIEVPVVPGQETVTVEATITDPAGNTSTSNDEKPVDNQPPELVGELKPQENADADDITLDISKEFTDAISGNDLTYQATDLPKGLEIDPNTGIISGTIDKSASQGGNTGTQGEYSVTITVTDPAGNSSDHDFVWTVTNPPPVATDDKQTVDEDTVAIGNVLTGKGNDDPNSGQDIDPDGDELKVTEFTVDGNTTVYKAGTTVTIAGKGELTLNENGDYTFTPEQDWHGDVPEINYTISDGEGGTADAKLNITVTPVNDAPVPVGSIDDQVNEDASNPTVPLDLKERFKDVDNSHDELTFTVEGLPPGLIFNPTTGEITGTIDKSASQYGPNKDGIYKVTVTATDPDGLSAEQNFTWTVTNPSPVAEDDAGETSKSVELTVAASSGILSNDTDPDGDDLAVAQVIGKGGEPTTNPDGSITVKGEYGTLILQPDGSYIYTPDLSNDTVWELPKGSQLTDNFTYIVSDGEGGEDTAKLVITINGHSNTPPFLTPSDENGPSVAGEITVHEKGLAAGTEPGQEHIANGIIDIAALDGLTSITIDGQEVQLSDLENLATDPIILKVPGGQITLTGFEPIIADRLGVEKTLGGKLSYDYQLTTEQDHNSSGDGDSLILDIQLGVKDDQGAVSESADNILKVNVIDDAPTATDDANTITEDGNNPVTGNVLTNDATGADGATVTGVQAGEVIAGSHVADGHLPTQIAGKYGTLALNADGTYSYELDNTNLTVQGLGEGETLTDEVFSYTITDSDGDQSTATLTITINGANDDVTVVIPKPPVIDDVVDPSDPTKPSASVELSDQVVFESGLANGSNPDADATKVVSNFTLKALDGLDPTNAFSITYKNANGVEQTLTLGKDAIEALGTTPQIITTQYGELVLNGYSQAADGTITIDYEYTLQNAPSVDAEFTTDDFTIIANDRDGDDDSQKLSIKIVDDAPVAVDDVNSITEDEVFVAGNVMGGTGAATGDVADTQGADGADVSGITSTNAPTHVATDTAGVLEIEGQYGTLTINPDGSYSYVLDNSNLAVQGLIVGEDLTETFNYTITDGDGDSSSADLIITINGANDGVTVTVPDPTDPADPNYPVEDPSDPALPTWGTINDHVVFESGLVGGSQNNTAGQIDGLVKVESSFTLSALDGLDDSTAITFAVTGKADSVLSKADVEALSTTPKTISTEYGELVLNGYSQAADGTITIDYEYILTKAPENTAAGDGSNADKFTDDTINITVNDRDTDTGSDSQDLIIRIMDDVPVIDTTSEKPELTVDETTLGSAATKDFAGIFTPHYGADGQGTVADKYKLIVNAGADSGLVDTATGTAIKLYIAADGSIEGRIGDEDGDLAFTLTVAANGKVTLTQNSAVKHPDTADPDDLITLKDSGIELELTITDTDGDTATESVNIGQLIGFRDDGPTLEPGKVDSDGFVTGNSIVDEKNLTSGSEPKPEELTVTKELPIDFGADGAVNAANETGLIFANTAALEALNLKSSTTELTYQISADGHTITATAGAKDIFTITLIVDASGKASYEFTLKGPLDHTLENDIAANIELPFDITATDGDGDSVDLKFKVEVADDTPATEARELAVDEDGSVSFSNADINQTTTSVKTDAKHGEVTIGDDGTITYTPHEDYRGSDSYTYTVTTASGTYERTVNITVNPVADKPLLENDKDIVTPEDVEHSLGLTLPEIKDKGGQGDPNAAGYEDYSELLGAITLTPSGAGYVDDAKLQTGAIELTPDASGKITIVIVDESGEPLADYHVSDIQDQYPESADGTYYLTKAEYEAITAHPAEDRHENFEVTVSVDSYEVDADGKKLSDVNGANSKQTITVDVQAVTDKPELTLTEDNYTFDEDTTLDLTTNLVEGFTDIDGSESFWYEVEGLAPGTVVTINGQSYTANSAGKIDSSAHKITVDAADKNPEFTIKPPNDFSGDMKEVKITLKVQDSDSDSPNHTPAIESAEVTLDLFVKPIAGDVNKDSAHTIDEDNPVAFLSGIEVTDKSSDATGGEVMTKVEFTLPTDANGTWTLSKQPTPAGNLTSDGWQVSNTGDAYTIEFNDDSNSGNKVLTQSEREDLLKEFEVTPPAHSSLDAKDWMIKVTTQDSQTVNSNKVTSDPVETEHNVTITVKPVAERVDADSDGANGNDVTMGPNHVYHTSGAEDEWFALGAEGTDFKLSNGWSNEDGKWVKTGESWAENTDAGRSEDTFALLTPYSTENNDAQAGATVKDMLEGSVFTYSDGTTTFTIPFAGEPVKIPMQYLDSVQFKGPKDWSGVVKVKVEAHTVDYDEDDPSITDEATSGEAWLTNLIIEPRADQVTLKVDTPIKTLEDTPVKLNIQPTSSDKTETFDVTISGIPKGTKIKYWENNIEKTFTADADNSSLSITNFDKTKQPELTPPTDSNDPINLTVKAESVDTLTYIDKDGTEVTVVHKGNTKTYYDKDGVQVGNPVVDNTAPDTSHQLPINIEVQGVPDKPILEIADNQAYFEDGKENSAEQGTATGLEIPLSDLITKLKSGETGVDGAGPDGSETVTLRITDLPEGFTLTGAGPQLGGSGESRVWVISESQLNDVKITVPANYSGTVDFTVQPVVTENDNPSEVFFDKQNVKFEVNPVPEATLSISSELIEDTVGKLDMSAVHQNGDVDEFISAVKIAVVPGFTFYSDAAGTTKLEAVDGYYVISGKDVNSVYVKGPANFSGNQELVVEYKVTDPSADLSKDPVPDDAVPAVESDWISGSHNLIVGAVTDSIGAALNTITAAVDNPEGSFNFDDTTDTATINGTGKVTVKVDISQQADANADGETDTDGSEQLTHIVIDGVPQGVSVEGAVQTGPGQWLLEVNSSFNTETLTQDVVFNVTGVAGTSENNAITITGYSKDTGASSQQQADISFNLNINQGPGPGTELPTVTLSDKNTGQTEDVKFSLAEQVDGSISGGNVDDYQITVTLRTSPDDETVYTDEDGNQLIRTEVIENGEPVILWTKSVNVTSGDDADAKLDELLDSIKVQAPEHANNNNLPGGLPLDVTVSVHANGLSKQDQLKPTVSLTPETDETTIIVTADPVGEGEDILINIELENIADGEFSNIEGNTITVTLDGSELAGELLGADGEPLTPTTAGGNIYEVALVDGKPPQLTFRPDSNQPHQTGSLDISVSVTTTEQNAANTVTSTGSESLVIEASNSGFEADITAQGDELNSSNSDLIKLELTNAGLIDSGEQIDSAFISGLPSGFTVWVGDPAAMANNAGGGTWAIPLDGNNLPANISIKPPKNWAGTLDDLKFTVMSGHDGLTPTASEIGFELVVNPTPDGVEMNPTLSFGDAGDKIELNLNASMKDPSKATGAAGDQYTELTELSLTGFPDGQKVQFFIGDSEVPLDETQAIFDGDTWTITGLSQEDLQNLSFLHAETEGSSNITVQGRTYEVDAEGNPYQDNGETKYSAWSDAKMAEVNVSATVPTSGADHFLWDGSAINGFGGEDTVQLRFGDNLEAGDFGKMENIEIIDMQGSGANSIIGLTVEDVFNMTDGDNILKILGDAEDSIDLTGWGAGTVSGDNTLYIGSHNGQEVKLEVNTIIID